MIKTLMETKLWYNSLIDKDKDYGFIIPNFLSESHVISVYDLFINILSNYGNILYKEINLNMYGESYIKYLTSDINFKLINQLSNNPDDKLYIIGKSSNNPATYKFAVDTCIVYAENEDDAINMIIEFRGPLLYNSIITNPDELIVFGYFSQSRYIPSDKLSLVKMNSTNIIYAFQIDESVEDPFKRVTYLKGYMNEYFTPARMNFETGKFEYGSWENAWFIKDLKPCMLNYDGTVAYELNKNDYTQKINETPVPTGINSLESNINAMIGVPTVWLKYEKSGSIITVYVADKQISDEYHAYAHTDKNGNIMPYTYMSIYNGHVINDVLRSVSGDFYPSYNSTVNELRQYANANNTAGGVENIWDIEVTADRQLINMLLVLIGKSTDTQEVFGKGVCDADSPIISGTMDDKGLFWGSTDGISGVKVFGMENWWGNINRRIAGWIYNNGRHLVKMTYGTQDGSSTTGYNETGIGYIDCGPGNNGSWIKSMNCNQFGLFQSDCSGSDSTYYCDYGYYGTGGPYFAYVGGNWNNGSNCGAFYANLNNTPSNTNTNIGAGPF